MIKLHFCTNVGSMKQMNKVLRDTNVCFQFWKTANGLSWSGPMPYSKRVWEVWHPAAGWKKWAQMIRCYLMIALRSQMQNGTINNAQNAHTERQFFFVRVVCHQKSFNISIVCETLNTSSFRIPHSSNFMTIIMYYWAKWWSFQKKKQEQML